MNFRNPKSLRVWLIHDWLTGMRGGEKVLLELTRLFPQAQIATLFYVPNATHPEIERRITRTSMLQQFPDIQKWYRHLLPLLPLAIKTIDLPPADLVISTCHCVAKGVNLPSHGRVPHICYCFTPMRYIWDMQDHYTADRSLKRQLLNFAAPILRQIDLAQNRQVTAFAGTCRNVTERITRCYHNPATIIYPGIDTAFYQPLTTPAPSRDFYLVVSALVPYKRIDLAVRAFATPWGQSRRLVIIGKGPEETELRRFAANSPNIEFHGWASDTQIRHCYQNAAAFLFPGEEDFGLTPLEAQACGTPVVAFRRGGVLETVPETLGFYFDQQTPAALQAAVDRFESVAKSQGISPSQLTAQAQRFTWENFRQDVWNLCQQHLPSC